MSSEDLWSLRECPHCGESFKGAPGLSKHIELKHADIPRVAGPNDKECPQCGKIMSEGSLTRHMRKAHGVVTRPRRSKAVAIAPRPESTDLTADQIAAAAAGVLFPQGVPHTKLQSLLRWTVQTHEFLEEAQ